MIEVANPIYDVVFKYLLDDDKIAKLLISGLLKQEVISLELKPQEYSTNVKTKILTVYRIDFKARIRQANGEEKIVLIEIQKAKFTSDILRFRKYLGEQYIDDDNTKEDEDGIKKALPIISIYFLGYPLENAADIPIISINRQYLDHSSNEVLNIKEHFVESLSHDSIIIQITALKKKRQQNDLEKALSVFQQGKAHQVSIDEDNYPEKYQPIIRRLLKAATNSYMRKTMDIEDEILADLNAKERLIERKEKEALKAKEGEKLAKEESKEAKEGEKLAKKESKQAKEKEKQAKEKEKQALLKLAKMMKDYGKSVEEISKETGLSTEEIILLE